MEIFCSLPVLLVLGGDVEDAVGVDVEGDFDLRHRRGGRAAMPSSWKLPSSLLSREHRALALADADVHRRLVVGGGGEDLRLLGRDGGVALDHRGGARRPSVSMRERQRGDVEQQHVLDIALEHAALDGGADGDDFVRVHALGAASLPASSRATSTTFGMRVMPPTSTSSSMSRRRDAGFLEAVARPASWCARRGSR